MHEIQNSKSLPSEAPQLRRRTWQALAGALVLALLIPSGLVGLRLSAKVFAEGSISRWELLSMAVGGTLPAALVLAPVLLWRLRKFPGMQEKDEGFALALGAARGGLLAYANLLAYPLLQSLAKSKHLERHDGWDIFRFLALFAVTGACCGSWIAWQAYRERHPQRGFLPRFSLRTLVILSLGWGGLLWLFRPA